MKSFYKEFTEISTTGIKFYPKVHIVQYLYDNRKTEIECKDIIEDLEIDKFGLSKILSGLAIEGMVIKEPIIMRIQKSDSYFNITLTKKGIKYARRMKLITKKQYKIS